MSATITSFAIRYRVQGRVEVLFPKTHLTDAQVRAHLGHIIDRAHKLGHTLDYIHVVPCAKRPGTKVLADISRQTLTQKQLVHACNVYHRAALAAAGRSC